MSKIKLVYAPALLLLSLLSTGCMATRVVEVGMASSPEEPIIGHAGIGLFDMVGKSTDESDLARRLTGRISTSLSNGEQLFTVVSAATRDEVKAYIDEAGERWDNFGSEYNEQLQGNYGGEIPMSGYFDGQVILTVSESDPVKEEKAMSVLGGKKDAAKEYEWVRKGSCELQASITFHHVGTGAQVTRTFTANTGELSVDADIKANLPGINYSTALSGCLNTVVSDFEKTWVSSMQNHLIPLFVGDGVLHMSWEDDEYANLVTGYERMESGQYALAEEAYARQESLLTANEPTMQARTWYDRAVALEASGKLDAALDYYWKATQADTDQIMSDAHQRCKATIKRNEKLEAATAPKP